MKQFLTYILLFFALGNLFSQSPLDFSVSMSPQHLMFVHALKLDLELDRIAQRIVVSCDTVNILVLVIFETEFDKRIKSCSCSSQIPKRH